ncbi:MAG TPA: aminotransferase class V-fold PLP-dependent enzyme [Albidovulum sp.]|uniref:pyridoxal-phosphate-dependent aminotransferase family protein n=1 Tax=Albidovulum sp. TaxID=1872424 RepID=UPI001DA41881|nr:alanine--glyoxylate aminotransferase family protein [Paracoccaceae bacterium]HRV64150.1 aminotransferase class V-fold PLP-dependent enzyme [Albidovulum sp.]
MNLSQGRPYLAIPGPSVMPDRVLAAMHRPAPDIYAGALIDMTASLYPDLRAVARTAHHVAIYIGNGHAAWEAANTNLFSRGDRAMALVTGQFGTSWANAVERLGVRVDRIDFGRNAPADPARLADALRADVRQEIKAVLLTHVDTASTVKNDVAAIRSALDGTGHPALLAVDCIASLGCDPFEMDLWGVDVMVGASQKGLMTPPGLGFVWFSDRAAERCRASDLRTPYWDWTPRAFADEYWQQFCGTAPTHHLFALREALTMLVHEEGLEAAWARHRRLAGAVWAAVDAWGQGGDIRLNIADPAARGNSVTSVRLGGAAERLRAWCEAQAGVTLGIGLGMESAVDWLRIAHMGHVNAHMTLGALSAMEAGLRALGVPRGDGALNAATEAIAGA